jgi:hypothetical protein
MHCCILLDFFFMNCTMVHGSMNIKFRIEFALDKKHKGRHVTYISIVVIYIIFKVEFINHLQLIIVVYSITR